MNDYDKLIKNICSRLYDTLLGYTLPPRVAEELKDKIAAEIYQVTVPAVSLSGGWLQRYAKEHEMSGILHSVVKHKEILDKLVELGAVWTGSEGSKITASYHIKLSEKTTIDILSGSHSNKQACIEDIVKELGEILSLI